MIILQFLRNVPLFEHLSEKDLREISTLFSLRHYGKGENVFLEGTEGNELYIIKTGVIKIYKNEHSREIILSIFRDGDFFGEMALLQQDQVRSAAAKALEKSTVYILNREDFVMLLKNNPEISMKILEALLNRLRAANELIADLTILDARIRIARMLLRLSEKYGVKNDNQSILINLKLTHQQMADMTGTVRETVTKSLLDLQQQGLIQTDRRKIMIKNLAGLKELVEF